MHFYQNNGCRAQTIHQEAIHQRHCPVRAVIHRLKHILSRTNDQDTIIGTFFTTTYSQGKCVTTTKINNAVKQAVKALNLNKQGLLPQHVGCYNLQAGGAMAMHLNKVDYNNIKKWVDGHPTCS